MSARDKVLYILGEATITLYATQADGTPITTARVWMGACPARMRLAERWKVVERRPLGSRWTRHHPLTPTYTVELTRPWVLAHPDLMDFEPDHRRYVLDVVWEDDDGDTWHRNTFYGVTIAERTRDARDVEHEYEDGQSFAAEYYTRASGEFTAETPTVPAIDGSLPLLVRWEGADGSRPLYTYDPATHEFTELGGLASGRAAIAYTPDLTGDLSITFAGESEPVLTATAAGLMVTSVRDDLPLLSDLPRLDFYRGRRRVAALSKTTLYVPGLTDGTVTDGTDRFGLYGQAVCRATLGETGLRVADLTAPGEPVTGLDGGIYDDQGAQLLGSDGAAVLDSGD